MCLNQTVEELRELGRKLGADKEVLLPLTMPRNEADHDYIESKIEKGEYQQKFVSYNAAFLLQYIADMMEE